VIRPPRRAEPVRRTWCHPAARRPAEVRPAAQ
jgi:hypothetical protein